MEQLSFIRECTERLCREEFELKKLGLHSQAAGLRQAVVILIRMCEMQRGNPPVAETCAERDAELR